MFGKILPSAIRYLSSERERLALWVPPLLMLGIGPYFALAQEPPSWLGAALLAAAFAVALRVRKTWLWLPALALVLVAAGFGIAQMRTLAMKGPLLTQELSMRPIEGRLANIDLTEKGAKLTLEQPVIEGLAADETPPRIRVSLRQWEANAQVGDVVALRAALFPLPEPVMPGAYDFSRFFYFKGLGATGYSFLPPEVKERATQSRFSEWLERLRAAIARDMMEKIPAPAGAVAAALTMGDQGGVPDDVQDAMRDAGITHVLSISGLHLALASGLIFFCVRLLLVAWPRVGLRVPAKKIAAAAALAGAYAYLLLAGSPVPAQRSFIMVAFVLAAVMLDRRGISIRALAWAAVLILLLYPESMLGASFQMSFAATLAIVSLYERYGGRLSRGDGPWFARVRQYMLGIAATSMAATFATAPFVIYHFNRMAAWGLLANMLVIPLAGFIIMPGVVVSLLLMPFGLQWMGYWLLEKGIALMIAMAHFTAGLPGATVALPPLTDWGLVLAAAGIMLLAMLRSRLRLAGAGLVVAGLATMLLYQPPDMLISGDGRQVMARLPQGEYVMLKGSTTAFAAQAWERAVAGGNAATLSEMKKHYGPDVLACNDDACTLRAWGKHMVVVRNPQAASGYCAEAIDVLIAWWYMTASECRAPARLIDRRALEQGGAHALYLQDLLRVDNVAAHRGHRPWMPLLQRKESTP